VSASCHQALANVGCVDLRPLTEKGANTPSSGKSEDIREGDREIHERRENRQEVTDVQCAHVEPISRIVSSSKIECDGHRLATGRQNGLPESEITPFELVRYTTV
jgi:hypothetical protein